jgi:hypothetical protein
MRPTHLRNARGAHPPVTQVDKTLTEILKYMRINVLRVCALCTNRSVAPSAPAEPARKSGRPGDACEATARKRPGLGRGRTHHPRSGDPGAPAPHCPVRHPRSQAAPATRMHRDKLPAASTAASTCSRYPGGRPDRRPGGEAALSGFLSPNNRRRSSRVRPDRRYHVGPASTPSLDPLDPIPQPQAQRQAGVPRPLWRRHGPSTARSQPGVAPDHVQRDPPRHRRL